MSDELENAAGYEVIHALAKKTDDENIKLLDQAVSGYLPEELLDQQVKSPKDQSITKYDDLEQGR